MSFNGVRLFRYALLFEIGANATGIIPCLFFPQATLSFLATGSDQITDAAKSLTQWFPTQRSTKGLAFTLPLVMCYPNPTPSKRGTGSDIVAWRRLTYIVFGAGEAVLGTTMLAQWAQGGSGIKDVPLLLGAATLGGFMAVRAFFLYARPQWMGAQENVRKVQ